MKLRGGSLELVDVETLEGRMAELISADREVAGRIVDEGRLAYGELSMRLLMSLYAECMASVDVKLASSVFHAVIEHIDRRKSRLREPTIWKQLNIPIDLSV
jgi:hypothetical protein